MTRGTQALVLAALVVTGALTGCKGQAGEAETPGTGDSAGGKSAAVLGPNDVATADRADLVSGIPVSGTMEPGVDLRIASPIAEVLTDIPVKEGQVVKRGDVLARFTTVALGPAAASAETQRRVAQADLQRMQNLYQAGAVSQKDVETAELSLKSAEAAAAVTRQRLDQATLRAPVSGVISERVVDAGARVKDGDKLFELVNTSELEFSATVPAQFIASIHVGAPVSIAVTGIEGVNVQGRVSRVNAAVDPATRQVKVYVVVPNADGKLVGGLFASGRVVLNQVKAALAIPTPGLRTDQNGKHYALIVAQGKIVRCDVTSGVTDEVRQMVEVVSGLNQGDVVIVGPIDGLHVGDAASIVKREG